MGLGVYKYGGGKYFKSKSDAVFAGIVFMQIGLVVWEE